ncbi:MAG: hypothetical protein ACHRHE_22035 [Tepidisphaerales bacterium]
MFRHAWHCRRAGRNSRRANLSRAGRRDAVHGLHRCRQWQGCPRLCDQGRPGGRDAALEGDGRQGQLSLWIGKAVWSRDTERGHIKGITFTNILAASADPPRIELQGFDAGHAIEDVLFQNVRVNHRPLTPAGVKANEFVRGVKVEAGPVR